MSHIMDYNQSWAPAARFALTRHRVIDATAKNQRVARCQKFLKMTRCRVTQSKMVRNSQHFRGWGVLLVAPWALTTSVARSRSVLTGFGFFFAAPVLRSRSVFDRVFFSPFPAPAPIKNRLSTITHFLQHPTFLTRKNPLFLSILYFNYCSLKSMLKPTKRISLRIFSVLSKVEPEPDLHTGPTPHLPSPCFPSPVSLSPCLPSLISN